MDGLLYEPEQIAERRRDDLPEDLVYAARQGHLVLFLGAGLSAALPSSGPMGNALAEMARSNIEMWVAPTPVPDGCTLEEMGTLVADAGRGFDRRLQELLAVNCGLRDMQPNFAHAAVAHLLREGAATVVTTNWDLGLEKAAIALGCNPIVVTSLPEEQSAPEGLRVRKVHGCASRPASMRVSQAEIDDAGMWARSIVAGGIAANKTAFVGYGTVAGYVAAPIEEALTDYPEYASSLAVVSRTAPESWRKLLDKFGTPDHHASVYESDADAFLDGLLCRLILLWTDAVLARTSVLASHEPWGPAVQAGVVALVDSLRVRLADDVLRWWRNAASSTPDGKPFIGSSHGVVALMAAGHLVSRSGGSVAVEQSGAQTTVATAKEYVEILSRPAEHFVVTRPVALAYATERRQQAGYDSGRDIVFVLDQVDGVVPSINGVTDIGRGAPDVTAIDGPMTGEIRFMKSDEVLDGRAV